MTTVNYGSSDQRPSGKGHVQTNGQSAPFVSGIQGLLRTIDNGLMSALDVSLAWHQRIADRHSLRAMDDRLLKDIGLSHADVEREATKPFWRA